MTVVQNPENILQVAKSLFDHYEQARNSEEKPDALLNENRNARQLLASAAQVAVGLKDAQLATMLTHYANLFARSDMNPHDMDVKETIQRDVGDEFSVCMKVITQWVESNKLPNGADHSNSVPPTAVPK